MGSIDEDSKLERKERERADTDYARRGKVGKQGRARAQWLEPWRTRGWRRERESWEDLVLTSSNNKTMVNRNQ